MRWIPVAAVLALTLLLAPSVRADEEWTLDRMNHQVEATNVIVSGVCSGTIISKVERLVLTAYHCVVDNLHEVEKKTVDPKTGEVHVTTVQEPEPMYVESWYRQDYGVVSSERHQAEIKGKDEKTDTALLQVTDLRWHPEDQAPFASCDYPYERGQTVYAVGNPDIEFDTSVTKGIISAPYRRETFNDTLKDIPLFQHSAGTIGGNSGGALYNAAGELIGTVTGGVPGSSVGLGVPICFAKAMIRAAGFGSIFPTPSMYPAPIPKD